MEGQGRELLVASTMVALEATAVAAGDGTQPGTHAESSDTLALASHRYRELAKLGEGGMGVVTRVRDADLLRDLAVKRLRVEYRGNRHLLRQFLWEARVTAYLDHPNIVPLHDLALDSRGDLYFTMKYVDGDSLDQVLGGLKAGDPDLLRRFSVPRRLRLFIQLCQAIQFAHSRGVLHRDLKPSNIMLGSHGEVLVMDWGLSCALPGPEAEALHGVMPEGVREGLSGTPLYMSPEQVDQGELDVRSDVYTLGVILHELCALAPPYRGATVSAVLVEITDGTRQPLAECCPALSPAITAVAERAVALRPEDRYASVAELREDLEIALDGGTPHAEHASLTRRVARFYGRERNPMMAVMRLIDFEALMVCSVIMGASAVLIALGIAVTASTAVFVVAAGLGLVVFASILLRMRREAN